MAADRLDLLGDGAGAAPLGALERHVLEKMRDAVDLGRLVPRADIDPDAERDRVDGVDRGRWRSAARSAESRDPVVMLPLRLRGPARRAWARTKRATASTSFGRTVIRSRLVEELGQRRRQRRADAGGALDRVGKFRRMRAWPARPSASRRRRAAARRARRRPRRRYAGRSACRCGDRCRRSCRASSRRRPGGRKTAPRAARHACSSAGKRAACRGTAAASSATAAPLRPFSSNSSRSKLLDDLDVHARAEARLDRRDRHLAARADSARGCRCGWCRSPAARSAAPCARARWPA